MDILQKAEFERLLNRRDEVRRRMRQDIAVGRQVSKLDLARMGDTLAKLTALRSSMMTDATPSRVPFGDGRVITEAD